MNAFLLLILSTFWGGSFVAIKMVLQEGIPPIFCAMLRVGLSLIFVRIFILIQRKSTSTTPSLRLKSLISGLFNQGMPFCLLFWGERFISPGLAGILNGTTPIWIFFLGLMFLKNDETYPMRKIMGLILGMVGIITIFSPIIKFEKSFWEVAGTIAVTLMAVNYGIGTILTRKLLSGPNTIPFHVNVFYNHVSSFLFLFIASFLFEKWPTDLHIFLKPQVALSFVYMSFFSTALAWFIYFYLVRALGALGAGAVAYLIPIMALFWDYLFFGHTPETNEAIGIVLILLGVCLIQLKLPSVNGKRSLR